MEHPLPPPEAVLIRLVRQAAHLSIAAAAERAGISTARWTQIEQGYETRGGERKPAWAPPDTLAHMAAAVGVSADRLETEGKRPDAAAVLREMQRQPDTPPVAGTHPPLHYADPRVQYVADTPGLSYELRRALAEMTRIILERDEAGRGDLSA